ncbi:MAG: hypothetical protein ACKV22_35285 [Bryobacteraceae bacterium]
MTRRELVGLVAVPAFSASEGFLAAEVKPHHGTPTLFINGQPSFSASYWVSAPSVTKWESAEASRRASAAGIHTYAFDVGSGTEWVKPDFDFSTVKARFGRILDIDPAARFHLRCHLEVGADDWWSKLYPQELELHSNGRRYTQSFASRVWREQANGFLRAYIQKLSETGLLDRVVAFQVGAGHTGEWVKGETSMYDVCGDLSEPMRRAFRAWLRARYGENVDSLRKAWNNPAAAFETAEVPSAKDQLHGRGYLFRDPRIEGRTIDYFRCLAELSADAVIDFCHTVKQATGAKKLAGAFYGYVLELAWNGGFFAERADSEYSTYQRSGHLGLRKVLNSPHVDFLVSPYSYGFRGIGGDGPSMIPAESARLHGKLVLIEDDTRTHIGGDTNYGRAATLAESIAILRRNFAGAMTRGQGMWWLSGTVDPAREPAFAPLLRDFERLGQLLLSTDRTPASEVAVLVDDESFFYQSSLHNLDVPGIFQQRLWGLPHIGTPVDTYLLQDLIDGRLRAYKLYVFLNAYRLDSERRQALARNLRRDGRVALWIYAPGYLNDDLSLDHMTGLTGFKFGLGERPWGPQMHLTNVTHPLTKGLPRDLSWGTNSKLAPIFYVDDPSATILGQVVYSQGNCKPGLAVRTFPEWTSIYVAAPNLPAALLRNVAKFAGAHIYSDEGDVLYATRELLGVHTVSGGPRRLRLPRAAAEIVDLFAGKVVARGTSVFDVELPPASTVLYLFRG